MNKAEYLKLKAELSPGKAVQKNKFNNKIVYEDGLRFDSELERGRYLELKLLVKAGLISDLKTHVAFELADPVEFEHETRRKTAIRYVADFVYFDLLKKQIVVEDTKSKATRTQAVYRMKKHLMKSVHGIEVVEICTIRA